MHWMGRPSNSHQADTRYGFAADFHDATEVSASLDLLTKPRSKVRGHRPQRAGIVSRLEKHALPMVADQCHVNITLDVRRVGLRHNVRPKCFSTEEIMPGSVNAVNRCVLFARAMPEGPYARASRLRRATLDQPTATAARPASSRG